MPNAVDVLAGGGIARAAEVIELAGAAKLELACAVVLLLKESGGGANLFGHDGVPDGGQYVKGGPVDQASYARYKAWRQAGSGRMQGVGPCQLTYYTIQDQADARGGCWDWRVNCAVGFDLLATQIRTKGVQDGFRAYNGAGPAAEAYGRDAMARLGIWRPLLSGVSTTVLVSNVTPASSGADSLPDLAYGLMNNPGVASLQRFLNAYNWRPALPLLPATGNYLDQTVNVLRQAQAQMGVRGGDGRNVGPATKAALWRRGWRG
jgi:hypothetical protein